MVGGSHLFDALDDDGLQLLVSHESAPPASLLALDVGFQLQKAGALGREQHLAAKFDGRSRVVALHAGQQRGLDAFKFLGAILRTLLQ